MRFPPWWHSSCSALNIYANKLLLSTPGVLQDPLWKVFDNKAASTSWAWAVNEAIVLQPASSMINVNTWGKRTTQTVTNSSPAWHQPVAPWGGNLEMVYRNKHLVGHWDVYIDIRWGVSSCRWSRKGSKTMKRNCICVSSGVPHSCLGRSTIPWPLPAGVVVKRSGSFWRDSHKQSHLGWEKGKRNNLRCVD
jgi:hypothetical protein